jgi:hypothetical protein
MVSRRCGGGGSISQGRKDPQSTPELRLPKIEGGDSNVCGKEANVGSYERWPSSSSEQWVAAMMIVVVELDVGQSKM